MRGLSPLIVAWILRRYRLNRRLGSPASAGIRQPMGHPLPEGIAVERFKPKLTAPLIQGWFAKESVTLMTPDERGNVIAASEPIDEDIDTRRFALIHGVLLRKEFSGYHEIAFQPAQVLGGKSGYMRRFEWTPSDGIPVTQIQLYYAERGRGYTVTATAQSTQFERFEMQFRLLLRDVLLEPT